MNIVFELKDRHTHPQHSFSAPAWQPFTYSRVSSFLFLHQGNVAAGSYNGWKGGGCVAVCMFCPI